MEIISTRHGINSTPLSTNAPLAAASGKEDISNLILLMNRYVFPGMGGVGLIGNILSMGVMLHMGLKKPSYIFLFALTFSDSLWFLASLDVSRLLIFFGSGIASVGWAYSPEVAYGLFIINQIIQFCSTLGSYASSTLPAVIMVERCLAVFFPLKFNRLVTPKRAWTVVLCVYLFWMPWILNAAFLYSFYYFRINGVYFGLPRPSAYYTHNKSILDFFDQYVFFFLNSWVPVSFVIIGAVVLGIKIKISHRKRQGLLSSAGAMTRSMTRTTRTLVSVSMVFAICNGYSFLTILVKPGNSTGNVESILRQTRYIVAYINSGCNIVIYLVMDRKFQIELTETFSLMLRLCSKRVI